MGKSGSFHLFGTDFEVREGFKEKERPIVKLELLLNNSGFYSTWTTWVDDCSISSSLYSKYRIESM